MSLRQEDFAEILVQHGHCGDLDEASVLADLVYQEIPILLETTEHDDVIHPSDDEITQWNSILQDVLGVDSDQSKSLLKELLLIENDEEVEAEEDDAENDLSDEGFDGVGFVEVRHDVLLPAVGEQPL